jgi:hypothetical protein
MDLISFGVPGELVRVEKAPDDSKPWQNPADRLDVDHDAVIAPIDAQLILNELNDRIRNGESLELGNPPQGGAEFFIDTNGDNSIAPIDAHLVINRLDDIAGLQSLSSELMALSLAEPLAGAGLMMEDASPLLRASAVQIVPEPATWLLGLCGALIVGLLCPKLRRFNGQGQ